MEKERNEMALELLHGKNGVEIKDNAGMATPRLSESLFWKDNDSKIQTATENVCNTKQHSR